jgi:hypothetical protein
VERRFWNPSLPQTLIVSAFLLYANIIPALLFRAGNGGIFAAMLIGLHVGFDLAVNLGNILSIAFVAGSVAAAYLIVNEKRNGWKLGIAVAAAPLVADVIAVVTGTIGLSAIIDVGLLFDIALFVALVHPQSREHQRIWFR